MEKYTYKVGERVSDLTLKSLLRHQDPYVVSQAARQR